LTEQQKPNVIPAINQQLDQIDKQANAAKAETQKLIEKRDKLNEQFKLLRQETRQLRIDRDTINAQVQDLKKQRNETRTTIHEIIDQIKAIREKIAELQKKTPKRSHTDLKQELEDIEWKIQTTSLEKEEERELIENVKQLETQLIAYKKIEKELKKIAELELGLKAVEETADKLHTELSTLAQKSQETHQKMLSKIDEAKKIKAEADAQHLAYLLTRERINLLNDERRRLSGQKDNYTSATTGLPITTTITDTQRQQDNSGSKKKYKKSIEKALEQLEAQARKNFNAGKINREEFRSSPKMMRTRNTRLSKLCNRLRTREKKE
jgi:uncharacterized coiled-coil DUF342 family protein